jgi:hypothetical protein
MISMSDSLVVSATDISSAPELGILGGRAINARMAIVLWAGTGAELYRLLYSTICRIAW